MFYYALDIAYATHRDLASFEFGFSREHIADICYAMLLIVLACNIMHGFY